MQIINSQAGNHAANTSVFATWVASLLDIIPPVLSAIASAITIVWFAVQLYDNPRIIQLFACIKSKIHRK